MEEPEIDSDQNDSTFEAIESTTMLGSPPPIANKCTPVREISPAEKQKLLRLPLARVKAIMKADPDCQLISQEALILVTKATELFLESLAKESVKYTLCGKRKTILKKDLDTAIDDISHLCFLDGTLD